MSSAFQTRISNSKGMTFTAFGKLKIEEVGCERGDSNPHPLRDQILSLDLPVDSQADQQLASANCEQVRQNPHPRRNLDSPSNPSSDPEC
jgi:hypothetical protein